MKRLTCWILMAVLLLTAIPAMAADNVRTSGDFQYTIKGNGTATIVGYTGEHADIILPNLIDGYTITTIGESAFALVVENGMGSQKESIFVTLPNTITSIEAKAFAYRNVHSINLPDTVEYIGDGAFLGNDEIQFRISNNHPYFATIDGSLYNKANKELLKWVQKDLSSDVVVPEGIISIGAYAFADMYFGMDSNFVLPESLKQIGDYAFWNSSIDVITIPQSVSEVGEYAFAEVRADAIQYLPENLKEISTYAFYECDTIKQWVLDAMLVNVETIEPYAFGNLNFWDHYYGRGDKLVVNIPKTCKIISEGAFCASPLASSPINAITIAEGVERIETKAFAECELEESVYLPASLTYIALDAFEKNTTYVVEKGSYAERWVRDNAFTYTINGEEQNLDWLNN